MFFFCDNIIVLFSLMILVGLMGGLTYVNSAFSILESTSLNINEKELALTVAIAFEDVGVLLASLVSLLLDNTLFHHA